MSAFDLCPTCGETFNRAPFSGTPYGCLCDLEDDLAASLTFIILRDKRVQQALGRLGSFQVVIDLSTVDLNPPRPAA